jgi:hypothetical protein
MTVTLQAICKMLSIEILQYCSSHFRTFSPSFLSAAAEKSHRAQHQNKWDACLRRHDGNSLLLSFSKA